MPDLPKALLGFALLLLKLEVNLMSRRQAQGGAPHLLQGPQKQQLRRQIATKPHQPCMVLLLLPGAPLGAGDIACRRRLDAARVLHVPQGIAASA